MTLESRLARAGQMARHVLVHGRPAGMEEMVSKVNAVSAQDWRASRVACWRARRPGGHRPDRVPAGLGELSADIAARKEAVGW
jgi:hypothetical protein